MKFDINFNEYACKKAQEYYKTKPDFKTAWQDCHRADWMLWIAQKLEVNERVLILAKALCAKTVIHLMKDSRSVNAVEVAERYGRGLADKKELLAAADAAAAAADAAAADAAAAAAADAAAAAADADADADADATIAAADAAAAYATIAAADAYAYAYAGSTNPFQRNRITTANICREILTEEVMQRIEFYTKN